MKKLFGKRGLALLTTMAILVSMVAMLSGLTLTSNAAYTPKRVISITSDNTLSSARIVATNVADKITAGTVTTVKGYYKVDNFTGVEGQVAYGYIAKGVNNVSSTSYPVYASTDGWKPFVLTDYTVSNEAATGWLQFGFTNAYGTFSIADVTIEDANGKVLYDFATDSAVTAGTYTGFPQQLGIWYLNAKSAVVDAVYTPKRAISITSDNTLADAKIVATNVADKVTAGTVTTVKGYYKVENFTGVEGQIAYGYIAKGVNNVSSTSYPVYASTDGWKPFVLTNYTVSNDAGTGWLQFGFTNAYGTFSIADVTIEDANGQVLYDLATDSTVTAGTYTGFPQQLGIWYLNAKSAVVDPAKTASTALTLEINKTKFTANEDVVLTVTGGDANTKIVASRKDNQWTETRTGASTTFTMSWLGEYQAYATNSDGSVVSNVVEFTVGASQATVVTDKTTYNVGETVTFTITADGDSNTLWIYPPAGGSSYYQNAGNSYTLTFDTAGTYGSVVQTWVVGTNINTISEKISFTVVDPCADGHNFVDGECADCGEPDPCADGHNFVDGECADCGEPDPCADGHNFVNGECADCGEPDPCADGHNFVDGECADCGEPDPCADGHNFVNGECADCGEPDPCADGHNFVDGECADCGEPDPCADGHNFVNGECADCGEPEPPAQTGDESMLFVAALGTFAIIALAALFLNKKKFNA